MRKPVGALPERRMRSREEGDSRPETKLKPLKWLEPHESSFHLMVEACARKMAMDGDKVNANGTDSLLPA